MSEKRIGQILRETREERKLSVRDISKDTNIAIKFILAMENEDYSQFPAETFILGFLKTYADYLKLDAAFIINQFKMSRIEESQTPSEETVVSVKRVPTIDKSNITTYTIVAFISVAIFLLSYYLYDSIDFSAPEQTEIENIVVKKNKTTKIPDTINFVSQTISENKKVPIILTSDRGVAFSVSNQQCKIFIKEVIQGVNPQDKQAIIGFNIFPEKEVYTFQTKVGEEVILNNEISDLSSLRREIELKTELITDRSAKIQVSMGKKNQKNTQNTTSENSGVVSIQVALFFLKPSFVEFVLDGQVGERGVIPGGEVKQLEARDRLELKIGDGGAVEMSINGKPRVRMGKPGKQVTKIFYKAPNPFNNTEFIIKEIGE
ncbi:MAG: helix-turn-helix domain-containing protein [Leptospiraceae bacterium]|nr:helix-turn-helix domain-containing protein [Leptospiraceae bacterium]MCP5495172.1 helix-turn-helix domain-containing protein [Leptospiraceae bacterium]